MLFGPVAYYAAIAACGSNCVSYEGRYDKRYKALHRYTIVDTRGPLQLTVPVSVPHGTVAGPMMRSCVLVSRHGEWWRLHRTALESAYGRTPYFEFVFDRFAPLFTDPGDNTRLTDFVRRADDTVRDFLGLPRSCDAPREPGCTTHTVVPPDTPCGHPYYQLRARRLGFVPHAGILDLIFNLGPEAPLYLADNPPAFLTQLVCM